MCIRDSSIGLDSVSVQITLDELMSNKLCSILHWNQNHFVVLYKVNHKKEYFFKIVRKSDIYKI